MRYNEFMNKMGKLKSLFRNNHVAVTVDGKPIIDIDTTNGVCNILTVEPEVNSGAAEESDKKEYSKFFGGSNGLTAKDIEDAVK